MLNTFCFFFALVFCATLLADEKSAIMQAKKYATDIVVADYFVSEKLDGVRARWDGKQLLSRNGKVFAAPEWFTAGFPNLVLDGELWLGRGQYQQTVSVVSRQQPHQGWRDVRYMLFDLPKNKQPFFGRYSEMQRLVEQSASVYLGVIEQQRITSHDQLMAWLDAVVGAGGEGLMLHHKDSFYMNGRSTHLLKLKKFDDAEAVVVGYKNGKGKYTGMVGSLKLRMDNGKVFYVGSGLTDDLRANPPPLGSMITFRHQGFTDSGLPRFPVYLRQRLIK